VKKATVAPTPRKKDAKAPHTKVPSAKAPPEAAVRNPLHAPLDWDQETSLRHWFPDAATRAELTALGKAAARAKTEAQKKKAWALVAALFPSALARLIGRSPWRWCTIPSPDVAAEAMRLLAAAPHAGTAGEVEAIERELERILPELPAVCLPEVVGNEAYSRAWEAINAAIGAGGDSEVAWALGGLRGYLATT
jgi:hypothetical protein